MNAYMSLAPFYDRLTADVDYGAFLRYYETLFALYGRTPHTVLDLACGTGTLTCRMAEAGYEMIGADASEEMLSQAAQKTYDLPADRRPLFLCQRMEELDLYGTVDCAICSLDGLNYLPAERIPAVLARLRLFLEPGGLFIFDINSPEKLRGLDGQAFVDETEDVFCVWRAELDGALPALRYGMDLFIRAGKLWRRGFEEHIEYCHEPEQLRTALERAGFQDIRIFGELRTEPPAPGEKRLFFAARNGRGTV